MPITDQLIKMYDMIPARKGMQGAGGRAVSR